MNPNFTRAYVDDIFDSKEWSAIMPIQDKGKRKQWETHIEEWQRSGLSQAEYCKRNQLRDNQLTYWKKRILNPEKKMRFIPLIIRDTGSNQSFAHRICVTTPNGFKIDSDVGIDNTVLERLISRKTL